MALSLRVAPLTRAHAVDVCTWRYPAPYDCYDMTDADPTWLLQPESCIHALLAGDRLVGFRSYGADGQVPGWEYDDLALDTGGGLRPELVGQGLGRRAIAAGLEFGREQFAPTAFRVTVASFNLRALRTVEGLGFRRVGQFASAVDGAAFEVLVRAEGSAHQVHRDADAPIGVRSSGRPHSDQSAHASGGDVPREQSS